jgi:hypothetical protein
VLYNPENFPIYFYCYYLFVKLAKVFFTRYEQPNEYHHWFRGEKKSKKAPANFHRRKKCVHSASEKLQKLKRSRVGAFVKFQKAFWRQLVLQ